MEKLSFTISALLQTVLGEGRDITFILLSKHNTIFILDLLINIFLYHKMN